MKVHEFSARLGIPASKIRYYDRSGVISGKRLAENNYREYGLTDALDIYNALMLRSFDMSVGETAQINSGCLVEEVGDWLGRHIADVERQIALQQMRLVRLQQMKAYFADIREGQARVERFKLQKNYQVWTLGIPGELDERTAGVAKTLAEHFPFSYVALKVPAESLFWDERYEVQAGLGILEENRLRCGIGLEGAGFETMEEERLAIRLEKEDPFCLSRRDLEPLFEEAGRMGVELRGDAVGRMYLGYTSGGRRVYSFALGIGFRQFSTNN